ncbi:hypothetical protein Moror_17245 [Moniliophthora roreri MCA 2997]|uniref:Major facilitator superfamily (MFS) profile domain-containing protein n=2 Tax=Moniliophthora roreri TaxID=221103 RepID=V2XY86_MONRO|nr:hypothetical protein Moror_17245 [Moniliophthora roreri MCA 2997]
MQHSQPAIELEPLPQRRSDHSIKQVTRAESRKSSSSHLQQRTDEGSVAPKSKQQIWKARFQLASLFWALFLAGWNDATTGPLLPKFQEVYNVDDTVVSLIFIFACLGFVGGSAINIPLSTKYGFGTMVTAGASLQVIAYTLQSPALPFPVFVMAYAINGFGIAIQDAQANGFVAAIKENTETKMGILHAIYGVGALCAPLVATQFAQLEHWSFHFLFSLGFAVINVAALVLTFRFKSQDDCLAEIGQQPGEKGTSEHSSFRQILGQRNVHLMAFFIMVYVGVEVTIGGWIVTFIIRERQGGPSSGYISSGFFGGLALGRVALLWFNALVGERNVMFIYATLAIGLELVVWLVPSLIGGGVAISLVGFLLGPMYPITINHAGRVLPRWILTGAIGWIAGFGQAGSAVIPFVTGTLAGKYGIRSLQPFLVSMMAAMTILWALVAYPSLRKKD